MDSVTNDPHTGLLLPLENWLDAFRQRRGQPQEELGILQQALESYPTAPALWVRLARVRLDLRNYDEAEWAAWQATRLDETDFESWYMLGIVRAALGKIYEAIAAHEHLLELAPGDPDALAALAHDLTIAGHPDRALPIFEALQTHEPEVTKFEVGLSRALIGLGRLTEAQRHLEHVIGLRPELSEPHRLSAEVHDLLRRHEAWVYHAHQAYLLRPDLPANIQWEVRALVAEDKVEEAVGLLHRGLDQNLAAYLLYVDLARVYQSQGEHDSALALLGRAAELAPFHGEVIAEQVRMACELNQPVDWSGLIDRATTQPFNHRLAIRAGKLCLEFGNVEDGLRLLALGTEGTEDIGGLTVLGRGLMGEARFQEAHDVLQRAVRPNLDLPETDEAMAPTWSAAALAAFGSERPQLAQQAFERALPWHQHDLQLWYAYGLLLFELEDWAAARQALEHVMAQEPDYADVRQAYQALLERST